MYSINHNSENNHVQYSSYPYLIEFGTIIDTAINYHTCICRSAYLKSFTRLQINQVPSYTNTTVNFLNHVYN